MWVWTYMLGVAHELHGSPILASMLASRYFRDQFPGLWRKGIELQVSVVRP